MVVLVPHILHRVCARINCQKSYYTHWNSTQQFLLGIQEIDRKCGRRAYFMLTYKDGTLV
uniref:Putative ATP-dependent RNA helicase DHX35 isoform X3 n=1 Tax=Rhizophora mucronata TaxID=61149 RepID=A0A2P2M6C9_RHIMU